MVLKRNLEYHRANPSKLNHVPKILHLLPEYFPSCNEINTSYKNLTTSITLHSKKGKYNKMTTILKIPIYSNILENITYFTLST